MVAPPLSGADYASRPSAAVLLLPAVSWSPVHAAISCKLPKGGERLVRDFYRKTDIRLPQGLADRVALVVMLRAEEREKLRLEIREPGRAFGQEDEARLKFRRDCGLPCAGHR